MTRTQPKLVAANPDSHPREDTLPGDLDAPDTERSMVESGIGLKALYARASASLPPLSARPLAELDTFLAMRLARLDAQAKSFNDVALVAIATTLRRWLASAATHAGPQGLVEPALADTLRGVYAWALGALHDVALGEAIRPLPGLLADALEAHLNAALAPAAPATVERPLREIARACSDLAVRGGRRPGARSLF